MGCDGGTIPTRGELVSTKKKPEKVRTEFLRYIRYICYLIYLNGHSKPSRMAIGYKARLIQIPNLPELVIQSVLEHVE